MPKKNRRSIGQHRKHDNWRSKKKLADMGASMTDHTYCGRKSTGRTIEDDESCRWFFDVEDQQIVCSTTELSDHDGHTADEFFLILDNIRPIQYDPITIEVDFLYQSLVKQKFYLLRSQLKEDPLPGFDLISSCHGIRLVQHYTEDISTVKMSISINSNFTARLLVHNMEISPDHDVWLGLPKYFDTVSDVCKLTSKLNGYSVCVGNPDEKFQDLVPQGSGLTEQGNLRIAAYREGEMGAFGCGIRYHSTIRAIGCNMLCEGTRCGNCSRYRGTLRKLASRDVEKVSQKPTVTNTFNLMSSSKPLSTMTREELILKCRELKYSNVSLERTVDKMKRSIRKRIESAETVDEFTAADLTSIMTSKNEEIQTAFPDPSSYQRLFWDEQMKYIKQKDARTMRWHPMMIKWCLHLQSKSATAYESLRESGFIKLPSSRTLFDYSHFTKSGTGFLPDIVDHLKNELKLKKLDEDWQKYAGILFDEMKIKGDLVYDKHSGDIVGFINLDNIGNDLIELENSQSQKKMESASHVLVLMVRGVANGLKYPVAHFSTNSITSEFIFPIVQQAIEILEIDCELKVLFVTCDGASANRRFFKLHKLPTEVMDSVVYCAINPYAAEERYIYFISDVPHLLKTTRNCFANSWSHKKSRKLWNNGDISWMHVVRLFEEHCSGLYRVVPKLSLSHVNLTAFSCMKVNLAAQVLSKTVACALETLYGDNTAKTVQLIRYMNKFFDCLNTRDLIEAQRKRNPDLAPYRSVDDERLSWLMNDFLSYFTKWKETVTLRAGEFSKTERNGMMISHQTLTGLEISVKSIVSSVKFLLQHNVPFVLTECFNQDPIEQHFGIHRQRCGGNDNPTLYEFNHQP